MKVTIVGGGTAGWMTAAFFRNNFTSVELTVIDKEVGNPIGVGEATLLDFADFMTECGYSSNDWIPAVGATFKSGIIFPDWKKKGTTIWHPFTTNTLYPGNRTSQWDHWSNHQEYDFLTSGLPIWNLAQTNNIDLGQSDLYAYHVDCSKLVVYIQEKLKNHINVIRSTVVNIVKENGVIQHLQLANGEQHHADLYIDCTGFLSLLKEQQRVDLTHRLFCNTAVVGQAQYIDKSSEMKNHAVSRAVDCGWIWQIPVQHRLGSGLVFNRDITDINDAKQYFINHWQGRISEDDVRVINWDPYYIKNFWEYNVVSIGLSGGFVEPLESTGLSLIRIGIKRLADKLKIGLFDQFDIDHYNATMIRHYEDVVDFVNMHYSDTERTETFWQYVKETQVKSDTQLYYEDVCANPDQLFYELSLPTIKDNRIFGPTNWILWLIQMGHIVFPKNGIPMSTSKTFVDGFNRIESMRLLRSLSHENVLETIRLQGINEK